MDFPELPFTAIHVEGSPGDQLARPMYGDGSLGEPDPTLLARLEAKEFGDYHYLIGGDGYLVIVWWGAPKMTPYGPSEYPSGRGVMADYDPVTKRLSSAALAEQRRLSHGHWGFYDDAEVRALIHNEGLEYGLTSYTDVRNFNEQVRPLALAAVKAINARDEYEEEGGCQLDEGEIGDEEYSTRLAELAAEAEKAKEAFCLHLGIDNEPWEPEA